MIGSTRTVARRARALGSLCAAFCIAALAGILLFVQVATARADDAPSNPKSTAMNLMVDETQIIAQVPTQVPIAVKGGGEFTPPPSTQLLNESVFAVHVAKVKATASVDPAFTLVGEGQPFANATGDDTMWMAVTAGAQKLDLSTALGDDGVATEAGHWNMAGATTDSDDDALSFTVAGAIKNAKHLKTNDPVTAVTVQWTLAAGAPEPASAS